MFRKSFTFLLCLPLSAVFVQAQKAFQNGQAARAVVGQVNFTAGSQLPSQQTLIGPGGVAWAANRLFVADSNRVESLTPPAHRVLIFDTTTIPDPYVDLSIDTSLFGHPTCFVCATPASLSIGQDSFNPTSVTTFFNGSTQTFTGFCNGRNGAPVSPCVPSPSEHEWLNDAVGVASDGVHMAIADTDNNRVLIWNNLPTTMNQPPDLVVGQPDFATLQTPGTGVVSATLMRGPQSVWIKNNRLYVADSQDHRVLIWNTFPTTNNQAPSVVLGQPDFTHANTPGNSKVGVATAANQLLDPSSVTTDDSHIFVSDLGHNRVLIWNTLSPGTYQNADVVVGQSDFTGSTANSTTVCPTALESNGITNSPCAFGLNTPRFALSDGKRLFIADGGNDRVLIYNSLPATNGVSADNVLGQTTFTTDIVSSAAISIVSTQIDNTGSVDTIPSPTSLAWDGTNLYVADPFNRRVLIFTPGDSKIPSATDPSANVIPVVNWASEIVRQEGTVSFAAVTGGTITASDTVTVTIQSVAYTYTEKTGDTADTIAKAVVRLINASDKNVTATFAGTNSGSLYLSSIQANLGFDTITLAATASNTNNVLASASGSYLTAGNSATASPFALIEVNAPPGVAFTDSNSTANAPLGAGLPNQLSGVELYLDGVASPLLKVSKTQIVGQIPYFFGDRNSTSVYVRTVHNDGSVTVTNATPVYIAPANPGIFNAQQYAGQPRPWPVSMAYHQLGNPTAVVSVDGSVTVGDKVTITIASTGYTYTVVTNDTLASVVTGLVNLINASDPNVTAAPGGAFTRVVLTAKLSSFSGGNGIAVATSTSSTSATELLTAYTSATCCAVQSGSLIYPGNPAAPGELISISAAGLGVIQDANGNLLSLNTGVPFPGPGQNNVLTANFVAATMGGQTAQVIYSGLPVGSYGSYRLDLVVPSGLSANDSTPLYIAQNAFISNTVSIAVGAAVANPAPPPASVTNSPINMFIDSPQSDSTVRSLIDFTGWALDSSAAISAVSVLVDGVFQGNAAYGYPRPDVCAVYPGRPNCPNVGYDVKLDTATLGNGIHTFEVTVTDANGLHLTIASTNVNVQNDPTTYPTHVNTDTPFTGAVYHGVVMFGGWALNDTAPIVSFKGAIDATPIDGTKVQYGFPRPDVCALYPGRPGCNNVGWTYLADLTGFANGTHTFSFTAVAANGQQFTSYNSFVVNNFSGSNNGGVAPVTFVDSPSATAGTLSGSIPLAGWAIDPLSSVSSVALSVDGVSYGNANYGVVRNDVCTVFSNPPGCPKVGWSSSLDTTQLADGTHTLSVTSYTSASQPYTLSRTFTVGNLGSTANPIRIGVDMPNASSPALAAQVTLGGWALSDSATIQSVAISVDGIARATATYGASRPDVCTVYPSRPGCPNVGWTAVLDTTPLTNGPHTLEVTATDTAGKRATAAQSFTVANSNAAAQAAVETPGPNDHAFNGIAAFSGWALNANYRIISLVASVDGINVGNAFYGTARPDVCASSPTSPDCPNVGWRYSLDTTPLADGAHTFGIFATAADGTTVSASASFTVANSTAATGIVGFIDSPGRSLVTRYTGKLGIGGWLYDSLAPIKSVSILVDGEPFGNASINGFRPDVCTSSAVSPDCPNVGWGFTLDTGFLTNDVHTLAVTGTNVYGQSATFTQQFSTAN